MFFKNGNAVQLFLIDANDNTLLAGRMIGLQEDAVSGIKAACHEQLMKYNNRADVEHNIQRVYAIYSTKALMTMSKMYEFKK